MMELPGAHEALISFLYRAPIGLVQSTLDGEIEMLNPMSAQLLMPLSHDGTLNNLFKILDGVAPELRVLSAKHQDAGGVICQELQITLAPGQAGNLAPVVLSISLLRLDEQRLMAVVGDVTHQVTREQLGLARRLDDAARIDILTQMPNRTAVREHIARALTQAAGAAAHEVAVLYINCDRFRTINDTLGHPIGDEVLALMASRLQNAVRAQDHVGRGGGGEALAARIGGDEFVLLLDELRQAEETYAIAQRLLGILNRPYGIGKHQIHCAVSIGMALGAQASGDADVLLQNASIAMREAKRAGRACYVMFEPAMKERAARRGGIEFDLRQALGTKQLFVQYQPVVWMQGAAAGKVCLAGVEALVRWHHPIRGLVPPLDFIGIAEECGLIDALGDFVLETACRDFVAWQRRFGERAPGSLAVNLSRAQLYQTGLVASVAATLRSTGMRAEQLQFEVTESLAAQDLTVQTRLRELKALHLTLALDDFGTGYSSLASLHLLPVDTVKIDRSFISHADTSHHHRVLIDATVRVATSLGMSTVAEGIETSAQAERVRLLGCDKGQGYFYSFPLGASDLEVWLEGTHASVSI
jgi:predicted signal transduction protein with EAL and GGDEF domain